MWRCVVPASAERVTTDAHARSWPCRARLAEVTLLCWCAARAPHHAFHRRPPRRVSLCWGLPTRPLTLSASIHWSCVRCYGYGWGLFHFYRSVVTFIFKVHTLKVYIIYKVKAYRNNNSELRAVLQQLIRTKYVFLNEIYLLENRFHLARKYRLPWIFWVFSILIKFVVLIYLLNHIKCFVINSNFYWLLTI